DPADRGERFRNGVLGVRRAYGERIVAPGALELVPRPFLGDLPILVTGRSQQSLAWIAEHADGWVTYPRPPAAQAGAIAEWRAPAHACGQADKPFAQSLSIDLAEAPAARPRPIPLGFPLGREPLLQLLRGYATLGVGHVILNLKYGRRPAAEVLEE